MFIKGEIAATRLRGFAATWLRGYVGTQIPDVFWSHGGRVFCSQARTWSWVKKDSLVKLSAKKEFRDLKMNDIKASLTEFKRGYLVLSDLFFYGTE